MTSQTAKTPGVAAQKTGAVAKILANAAKNRPLRPLIVFGTRPEAIKLCPVVIECLARPESIAPIICSTGQHREMLAQVVDYFGVTPDIDLGLMKPGQTLAGLTAACLTAVDEVIVDQTPDCVVVQGDTTTVMAAAMAAFYHRVRIVHVEAGLRTGDFRRALARRIQPPSCRHRDGTALRPNRPQRRRPSP